MTAVKTLWRCPKCGMERREKLAKEVLHLCKNNRLTSFKRVEEEDDG